MKRHIVNFVFLVMLLLGTHADTTRAQTGVPDCIFFPETQKYICDPILSRWRAEGTEQDNIPGYSVQESLALFGYPISSELIDGLLTVQYFQHAVFRYETEGAPHVPVMVSFGEQAVPANLPAAPSTAPPPPPVPPAAVNPPVSAPPAPAPSSDVIPAGTAELSMQNDTGEAVSVQIDGPTTRTVSMAIGEHAIVPVAAPGYYEITLTAYCGYPSPSYFTFYGDVVEGIRYEIVWFCQTP